MNYKTKYLKYKLKYNKLLKEQNGGNKAIAKRLADGVNNASPYSNIFKLTLEKQIHYQQTLF